VRRRGEHEQVPTGMARRAPIYPGPMERTTSATYTVMFTDLVDSTAQRSRLGDVAADELQKRHQAILRDAIEANSGDVVKTTGDGVMAAFLGAADGLACAVELQQSIHDWNESNVERFGVRVGLSLGDAMFEDDDLHGTPVVEAARLCANAVGGEILCAEVIFHAEFFPIDVTRGVCHRSQSI